VGSSPTNLTNAAGWLVARRPETSFLWFTSPWKTLKLLVWDNYKWKCLCLLILLLIILFLFLAIYRIPVSVPSAEIYCIVTVAQFFRVFVLLARPALAEAGLMFCPCFLFIFLTISVRPIISTPMAIDERPEVSFFDPLRDVVVVTNFCWLINTIEFRRHSADSGRRLAAVQFGYAVHLVLLSSWASTHRGKWGQLQCCWKNG